MNAAFQRIGAGVSAATLAACSAFAPVSIRPGQTTDEVTQSMGQPTNRYALPQGGSRLEYARGPYGKQTYMVDIGADGRVQQVQQVLTEANFSTVHPGETREELLMRLGRPSERRGAFRNTELWAYRYEAVFCQWFVVTMNPDGRVRDAGYVPDPLCDVNDNGRDSHS